MLIYSTYSYDEHFIVQMQYTFIKQIILQMASIHCQLQYICLINRRMQLAELFSVATRHLKTNEIKHHLADCAVHCKVKLPVITIGASR